jgi:hypothetical protein
MTDQPEGRCLGCSAPIKWRFTPAGKRMPLDHAPYQGVIAQGTYIIESTARCRPAEPLFDQGRAIYMNHWATCPEAAQFKKHPGGRGHTGTKFA